MKARFLLPSLLLSFPPSACERAPAPPGGAQGEAMPPTPVTIATVAKRRLVEWGEFTGRVEAVESVELRPRVSGYITEVHFEAGSMVGEGDILFTIDQSPFETRRQAAQAELDRAGAVMEMARRENERVAKLLAARAIAPEQAENRESAYAQSVAMHEAAAASLRSAEIELGHTEVRAPIRGRISRAIATKGNYVTAGSTLLTTLVSVDPVHVYTDIDENSLLRLQSLQREGGLYLDEKKRVPVEVQLSGEEGFPHRGFIESFDNRLDAATGSMIVRCELPNRDGALTPGLFARVRLPMTAEYDALLIDEKALLTDQANKYVLGVTPENLTVYKPVEIGPVIEGRRVVRAGLAEGERIVVNGMARLPQPGMPVAPVAEPAAGPAATASTGNGAADSAKP